MTTQKQASSGSINQSSRSQQTPMQRNRGNRQHQPHNISSGRQAPQLSGSANEVDPSRISNLNPILVSKEKLKEYELKVQQSKNTLL
jgi:hypothetical protein